MIVGTKKAIAIAVRNNKTEKRYTFLKGRLLGHPLLEMVSLTL